MISPKNTQLLQSRSKSTAAALASVRAEGFVLPAQSNYASKNMLMVKDFTNVRLKSTIKGTLVRGWTMSAKTISASDLRMNLSDALDSISQNDILIVTRRGKKERAILDLDKLEDLLAANDPEYLASIKEARESSEYFSHEEVFGRI